MFSRSLSLVGAALALSVLIGLSGCTTKSTEAPPAAPVAVTVSHPVATSVTDYGEYTGRTEAVDSVEIRARVWGYLQKVHFKEGALVTKGDVLFEIDPREYQAQFDAANARVAQSEAALKLAKANNDRFLALGKQSQASVSQQDLDRYQVAQDEAVANLSLAKANLETARLNLEWTKVTAPISGRIGRVLVTEGNLVQSGVQTGGAMLTNIVSVDPIYVYFDVDEGTVLRVRQLIREGKAKSARDVPIPVEFGLANQDDYPYRGSMDFVDNQINPKTGTLRVRAVVHNDPEVLAPGNFVKVRAPIGEPHSALLIAERALDNDQGQKIVFVVNEKQEVAVRPVSAGSLHGGLLEIKDGLKPGDRVIVSGLAQVRPGMVVEPREERSQRSEVRSQRPEGQASNFLTSTSDL